MVRPMGTVDDSTDDEARTLVDSVCARIRATRAPAYDANLSCPVVDAEWADDRP